MAGPDQAGYLAFIRGVMGIKANDLPDGNPAIALSYNVAMNTVNPRLACMSNADATLPSMYAYAVYNLAGDRLVNYAQDQAGRTFFKELRDDLKLNSFQGGVINSASDESTSTGLVTPDAMTMFTLRDLQTLKTPWGRAYMDIAQDYGYEVGLS